MKSILFVDDNPIEFFAIDNDLRDKIRLYYCKSIRDAKEFLSVFGPSYFDYVYIDFMGTSLDTMNEIDQLNHHQMVITSGTALPFASKLEFVLKENLKDHILKRI